jgi:hypothetical protein
MVTLNKSHLIQNKISEVESELVFMTELKDQLSGFLKRIQKIVILLNPFKEHSNVETICQVQQVSSRYTMESERDVHSMTLNDSDKEAQAVEGEKEDNSGGEIDETDRYELDDNVELF